MGRTLKMLTSEELSRLLDVKNLQLPPGHKVREVKFLETQDEYGDDMLDIFIVLQDDVTDEEQTWSRLEPVYQAIRKAVYGAGESRFPLISAGTQREYEERDTYDPQSDE